MAVVFGLVYKKWKAEDPIAQRMAAADANQPDTDALSWYQSRFETLGMSNASPGADTLRRLFVLLIGLGVRESSGRYCAGIEIPAKTTSRPTPQRLGFFKRAGTHTRRARYFRPCSRVLAGPSVNQRAPSGPAVMP